MEDLLRYCSSESSASSSSSVLHEGSVNASALEVDENPSQHGASSRAKSTLSKEKCVVASVKESSSGVEGQAHSSAISMVSNHEKVSSREKVSSQEKVARQGQDLCTKAQVVQRPQGAAKRKRSFLARAQPLLGTKRARVGIRASSSQTEDGTVSQTQALPAQLLKDAERDGVDLSNIVEFQEDGHVNTHDRDLMATGTQRSAIYRRSRQCAAHTGPVSRLQRRKHQITSVAASLAASRVEIEEKRKQTGRSRAASWAKYGW